MRWAVACDHTAVELKHHLMQQLASAGHTVVDCNPAVKADDKDNYALIADDLCKQVLSGAADFGLLMCGSGQGSAMRANRHPGIRAALVVNEYMAEMARYHNDANVLVLGSRVVTPQIAERLLRLFAATGYEGGRHVSRVAAIDAPVETPNLKRPS